MEKKNLKIEKKNVKYLGYKECGERYENFNDSSHCSYSYILCTLKKNWKLKKCKILSVHRMSEWYE